LIVALQLKAFLASTGYTSLNGHQFQVALPV
jgi:hypothetical protein